MTTPREIQLFDGQSPLMQNAQLRMSQDGLHLQLLNGMDLYWPKSELRWDQSGTITQVWHRPTEAHFELHSLDLLQQAESLGLVRQSWYPRQHLRKWTIGIACASALIIGAVYVLLPIFSFALARNIDRKTERKIFAPLTTPLISDKKTCKSPEAAAAMDKIVRALMPAIPADIQPTVLIVDWNMTNAFALPGDYIVVTKQLLQDAKSWETVAGVMAHELQHVEKRHNLSGMIRSSIASLFWAILFGDSSGVMLFDPSTIKALSQLHYGRELEAEADAGAVSMLNQVRIDPIGLHQFLSTIDDSEDHSWRQWLEFLSTHPDTQKRKQEIEKRRATSVVWNHTLLNPTEWASLQAGCGT